MGRIVVGVDGSANAAEAVRWAIDEARHRGDDLEFVVACAPPDVIGVLGARFPVERVEDVEARGAEALERWLAEAVPDGAPERAARTVRCGQAAAVLRDRAADATLLVVGTRGLGGFRGLVLGSVAQQCVQDAPCPVVVVPPAEAARDAA